MPGTLVRVSPRIATNRRVDRAAMLAFLRERTHGVLLTTRRAGRPQASPVTYGVDPSGRVVVSTYPDRAKVRNAGRDATASLVALSDDFDGPWLQVDGTADVRTGAEAVEGLVEYYRAAAGEHPDWDEYRAAMVSDRRLVLRIRVTRLYGIAQPG